MKRKLATLFVLLCSAFVALGFASCQIIQWRLDSGIIDQYDRYTLELDTSEYDSIVPYGGTFNYQSVKIVYKAYVGENQEVFYQTKFSLKASMVTGGLDTSSIGQKELIIEYGGERFTLPYTVKYQVDFLSKGEVFNRQFVFNSDEVVVPEAKAQEGFTFAYWKSEVPDVLTGNLSIEAHYYNNGLQAPALETIDCTYDPNATIAPFTLPSNENGKWEFVDPTVPVGEVGEHKFEVRFLSSTDEIAPVENNFVTVRVAKKEIAAPAVSASLVYNGAMQKATVTDVEKGYLPYDVLNEGGVDAGKYFVTATLKDLKNYKWKDSDAWTSADESTGVLTFEYTMAPKQVQFVILSDEFTYNRGGQFPTYRFQDDFDNEHITAADVTVTGTPQINADTYEYGFAMSNPNFVGSCSGTFTIVPKELTFIVNDESFVYDGTEQYPTYSFADPEDTPIVYVMSGKSQTEVGTYRYGWLIIDDNYTGMHTGTFNITKPDVTVTAVLAKTEITYPADVPEITFQVNGFAGDVSLLNITAEKPSATVGTYVITPVVNNANVNATCIFATLTIKKGEATFYKPTLSTDGLTGTAAVYGEKISTVTFSDEGFGSWAWKNPDLIIDKMSNFSATAVFTPQNPNLNQLEAEFFITNEYRQVEKRLLDIVVTKNEYIYTGDEFALEYHLVDALHPESYNIDLSKLTVTGNVAETEAGEHSKQLEIVSDYYKGIVNYKLRIQKADVAVTLASNEATLKFTPDMTLATSGITLGGSAIRTNDNKPVNGSYTWEDPTFALYALTIGEETPVKVVFTPDDENNYNVGVATFNFTIIKADSKIQKLEGSNKLDLVETYTKVFDNRSYTFTAAVDRAVAGDYPSYTYTYKDSNGRVVDEVIEAGRYTLTIVATETPHYNGAQETVNIVVTQASNNWGSVTQEQEPYIVSNAWTYKERAATINATAVWGLSTLTIEYKNTTTGTVYQNQLPTDAQAGNYTATLRIPETSNWAGLESTITFTIRKGSVDIPMVAFTSNNTKNVAYNGNVQRPAVNGTYTDGDVNGVAYTVEYRTADSTNQGTYYVLLALTDDINYVWNGEDSALVEVEYTITTATNEMTSLTMAGWAYKGYDVDVNSPSITAKFGADTVAYTYYRDASCTTEISLAELKNAGVGTYYVKASIAAAENGNYTSAEKVHSFAIVEAEWTGNAFERTYEIIWRDGLTLAEIDLDPHYTWDAPETALVAGSVNSYAATYKIDNYLPVHGTFEVTVHKIAGVVSAQNKTFTYGANTFTLDENKANEELNLYLGVSTNHVGDVNVISYEISYKANEGADAESVTTIANAGVYTITVKLAESEHYAAATTTATLTINKVQNTQNILSMTATYGDDLNVAKDADGKTLSDYNDAYGEWSWVTSGTVGDAGTQTHTAKYTPKAEYVVNYAGRTGVEVTITVAKKAIALPALTASFVYNGEEQKPVVASSEYYGISSWTNENSKNVGEYNVTLTLISANYAWSGSGAEVIGLNATYRYTITKATLTVDAAMQQTAIYGDKVSEKLTLPVSTFNGNPVGVWSWRNVTAETTVGNVGEHYFAATCTLIGDDANNFNSVSDVTVTVTVNRAASTIAVQDDRSKVYDGNAFAFAAGEVVPSHGENATIEYSYQVGETFVSGLPTNVGCYQVKVTLGESANYASSSKIVTVEITKATNGWAAQAPSIADRTYGDGELTLLLPELTYHDENTAATVTYTHKTKENVSYTKVLPANAPAGEYSVKISVTGSANWLAFEDNTLSFEIKKAEITLPILTTSFVYNGEEQKPVVASSEYYGIPLWTNENSKNVGAYNVTLTLISDNYAWSGSGAVVDGLNATYSYAITKAQAEHIHLSSVQMEDWTYGDDAKTPSATAAAFVTIQYRYEQRNGENWVATTFVVNAGSYRVQAYVIGNDNYVGVDSAWKEFTVAKKLVESVDTMTGFPYDGTTTRTPIVNDGFTMTFSKNGVSVNEAKDAGEYKVVVTATANYVLAAGVTKEYTFTISPAQVSVSVTNGTFTYDGTEKSATIAFSGGTIPSDTDYTIANNKGTNAGGYEFTVTLNNNYIFEDETRTKELRFVIEKATWSGNTPVGTQNFTKVWHPGLTLAEFTLSEGYAWADATTALVPGTETAQYYPVVYTDPSKNYEPITLNEWATVQVLKAKVNVSTTLKGEVPEYDLSKAYTVTDLMNVTINTDNSEALTANDFVWTWTIDGGSADTITNAGTYSVNAALTTEKSAYYKMDTTLFEQATIKKAKAPVPGTITASIGATLGSLTIPDSEYGVWTFVNPAYTLTTTGDHHVDVQFTPNDTYSHNYAAYDAKLHISVGQTVVNTTVTTAAANYTGNNISVSINVKTGDDVLAAPTDYTYVVKHGDNTIATNNKPSFTVTEAGTYTIELTFTISDGYSWNSADGMVSGNTLYKMFVIGKATNMWTQMPAIDKGNAFTYGTAYETTAAATFGDVQITYYQGETKLTEKPVNAGEYKVRFFVDGTTNYTELSETISYTIQKQTIEKPVISDTSETYLAGRDSILPEHVNTATYTVAWTVDSSIDEDTRVNGVDVGSYTITISLKDTANYAWADGSVNALTATYTINPATATMSLGNNTNLVYNRAEHTVSVIVTANGSTLTDENYTVSGDKATNAGTHTVTVTLTNANYVFAGNKTTATETFTIAKAVNEQTIPAMTVTYGEPLSNAKTEDEKKLSDFNDAYGAWSWETAAVGNAGTKTFTANYTPNDTDNYESRTVKITVKVNKAANNVTLSVTGKMYDGTAVSGNLHADNEEGAITYTYSGTKKDGTAVSGNGFPTEAGTYTVTVTIAESTNYLAGTTTSNEFTISQATATMSLDKTSFVYDGTEHTVSVTVMANGGTLTSENYIVSGNTATNAGTHTVTVTLTNANYAFAEGTNTARYTITPKTIAPTLGGANNLTYTGSEQTVTLSPAEGYTVACVGSKTSTVNGYEIKVTNADSYTVTLTLENSNYTWSETLASGWAKHEDGTLTRTFTVAAKAIAVPTLSKASFVYNGSVQKPDIATSDVYTIVYATEDSTNVGEYNVTLTLKDENYKWNDAQDGLTRMLTYSITKATVNTVSLTQSEFTYTGKPAALAYTVTTMGDTQLTLGSDYTTPKDIATNVGTHSFEITLSDNFRFADDKNTTTLEYTIKKADITVTLTLNNYAWTYGQYNAASNTLTATATKSFTDDVTVQYRYSTTNDGTGILTSFTPDTQNAGTYYVQAYVEGSENYNGGVSAWTAFTIAKVKVDVSGLALANKSGDNALTYTGENQLPVTAGDKGLYTITINDSLDSSAMGVNVGTYVVKLALKDTTNCEWSAPVQAAYTYEIKPATATMSLGDSTSFVYDGKEHTVSVIVTANGNALTSGYTVSGNTQTEAGTHTVTVKLTNANYVFANGTDTATKTFTIAKAAVKYDGQTSFEVIYGATFEDLTLSTSPYGTWTFDKTGLIGNASDTPYTFTVKFTPKEEYKGDYGATTQTITVKVNKAANDVTLSVTGKTYDGTAVSGTLNATNSVGVTYTYSGTKANGTTVSGNGFPTEAGTYTVTVTIPANTNYLADTATSGSFTIAQAETSVNMKTEYNETWRADLTLNSLKPADTANGAYTWRNATVELTENLNIGSYTLQLVYTPTDSNNYKTLTEDVTVNVTPKLINVPTLSDSSFTYNGGVQKPVVEGNADYGIVYEKEDSTDVGKYKITLTLNSTNYKWSDISEGNTRTLSYSITPASLTWNDLIVTIVGAQESASQKYAIGYGVDYEFSVTKKDSVPFDVEMTPLYKGIHGTTYNSTTKPTNAGTYEITFTENSANYNISGEYALQLTISPIDLAKVDSDVDYGTATNGYYYQNELTTEKLAEIISCTAYDSNNNEIAGVLTDVKNLTFNGDNSYVDVMFTPTNTNYRAKSVRVTIKLKGVAYIGSTYYGTIESALAAATSGQTVMVVADKTGKVIVKEDCEVKTGVTLILPYDVNGGYNANGTATVAGHELATSARMVTSVILDAKVTVNGTIIIAGVLDGGYGGANYAGHTSGVHAELVLTSSAELSVNGVVNCYGFIREESKDNGSQVTVNKNGALYMPFVLRDFRGGSYMYALYDNISTKHIAPFNQFEMRNVMPLLRVNYGGHLYGWANLYASEQQNATDIKIIDSSSESLLQLTDSKYSYVTAKYDESTEICDLSIYGGATLNAMSLRLKILFNWSVTVSTQDVYFPLTWRYHITLDNHEEQSSDALFYMSKRYKLMTGNVFTVEEGASLTVGELMIYETFTDACKDSNDAFYRPYPLKESANFTVNGKLIVNTAIGGRINTNGNGQVTINSGAATTLTIEEATKVSGSSFTASLTTTQSITNTLALKKHSNAAEDYSAAGTYYGAQCADGTYAWVEANETFNISFEFGYMVNGEFRNDLGSYTISNNADVSFKYTDHVYLGSASISEKVTIDGREYILIFKGWYTKANTVNETYRVREFYGKDYVLGGTLYGVFEAVSSAYTVNFDASSDETTVDDGFVADSVNIGGEYIAEFVPMSETAYAYNAINTDRTKDYYLAGWYLSTDSAKTLITADNPLTLGNFVNGEVTLKALWLPKKTISFNNNTEYAVGSFATIHLMPEQLGMFELAEYTKSIKMYDNQIEYAKYFSAWKYNGEPVTALSEDLFAGVNSITLTAEWLDKDVLTLVTKKDNLVNEFDNKAIYLTPGDSFELTSYKTETITNLYDNNASVEQYFLGWYTKETGGTKITSVDATTTLYAQWAEKYTLILDSKAPAGYTFSGFTDGKLTLRLSPTQTLVLSPDQLAEQTKINAYDYDTAKQYTFSHWYLNNESITLESLADLFDNDDKVTIYAAWANKYTVNVNANKPNGAVISYAGGTIYLNTEQKNALLKDSTTTSFANELVNYKSDLTKSHYFDHWTYDDDSEFASGDKFTIDGTTTIKVQWIAKAMVTISVSNDEYIFNKAISNWSITIDGKKQDEPSGITYYIVKGTTITITAKNKKLIYSVSTVTITVGGADVLTLKDEEKEGSCNTTITADTTIAFTGKW